ncbi:MAG: TMEM165/GDT1 family protein, partial [Rhizobiaceae bacterium]|nr:TMEM165/GDT1 family protein [Rhizobiaceae bacterium]
YDALAMVVMGTTLGMLIANVPVVIAGQYCHSRCLPEQSVQGRCSLFNPWWFGAGGCA